VSIDSCILGIAFLGCACWRFSNLLAAPHSEHAPRRRPERQQHHHRSLSDASDGQKANRDCEQADTQGDGKMRSNHPALGELPLHLNVITLNPHSKCVL